MSKLNEITQEQPGGTSWIIWRRFLSTLCREQYRFGPTTINEETEQQFSNGTLITKYWKGVPYLGRIVSKTDKYYNIEYEDGDAEDLNSAEVSKYMKKNTGEGRMTGEIGTRMRLQIPLGDWTILANKSERMWPFYYADSTDTLYRSYRKDWYTNEEIYYDCHSINENDTDTYNYTANGNVTLLPDDASPTDVMDTDDGWRISQHQPMDVSEEKTSEDKTFMEFLSRQVEHITQYYTQIEYHTTPHEIYELFKSTSRVNIATDGGAIPLKGSLGFVFADEQGMILLTCYGQPSGNDPLSFRSEICALLAATRLVRLIVQYYDRKTPCDEPVRSKIQVYTDSLSMIKKLKAYNEYPTASLKTVLNSEWDVLSALNKALKWFPKEPKLSWVKSHQDDLEYDEKAMPLDAYLNSEADELATIGLKRLQEKPLVPMDPESSIQFHIEGRTITRDFKRTVRETILLKPLRKFYCHRFKWSDNIFDMIDWDIFRPVYKKHLSTKGIQWMHKFCIKKLPTGERIHKRDHFHDKRCTSCLDDEDDDHIFKCAKRRSVRKKFLNQIKVLRNTVDTNLCDILQEGLMAYFIGECMTNTIFRIRGRKSMGRYKNLILDEQLVIG